MKHSRLVLAALSVLTLGTWATLAFACEGKDKAAAASSKSSACTPAMAAKCTPEMAAACKAKGASATTASMAGSGCTYHGSTVSAVTASASGCGSKTKSASAVTASAQGAGTVDAVVAGAGGSCSSHGASKSANRSAQADCDGCADMAFCDGEAKEMGATVQVVPLKNGVMYVYTAIDANKVHAVQASMGRRSERMNSLLASGEKAHLCPTCKSVRGAIASGKLNREVVNIEGGCLTLMTSSDAATLSKIYSMAGLKGPMSVKS